MIISSNRDDDILLIVSQVVGGGYIFVTCYGMEFGMRWQLRGSSSSSPSFKTREELEKGHRTKKKEPKPES